MLKRAAPEVGVGSESRSWSESIGIGEKSHVTDSKIAKKEKIEKFEILEIKEEFIEEGDDSSIEVIPNESLCDDSSLAKPEVIKNNHVTISEDVLNIKVKEEFVAIEEVLEQTRPTHSNHVTNHMSHVTNHMTNHMTQKSSSHIITNQSGQLRHVSNTREKVCEICGDRFYNVGGLYMHHSMTHQKDKSIPLKFKEILFI